MKKVVSTSIKLALVVALFVLLFRPQTFGFRPDLFGGLTPIMIWNKIVSAATVNTGTLIFWLVAATLVKLCGIASGIIRWQLLLRGQGVQFPWSYAAYHWFTGRAIGMTTPGTAGLDGWRLLASGSHTKKWVECATVIVMEKIIGFIALTFLVLVTFPFGFKILQINVVMFAAILAVLLAFTVFCFSILFKPRIIQVLVLVLPVPGKVRNLVNRIGAAATAYDGHRGTLLLAVFFGVMVHAGTAFMYFCTMNAIRAENTSIYDVLFAAPLMIYASVLAPTMGGMGVREIVFSRLLGAKSGFDTAAIFGHLGWWCGEFIPLCLSAPLIIFGGRPSQEQVQAQIAEMRAHGVNTADIGLHLSAEEISGYRKGILATLVAGLFGGLLAGPIIGLGEAAWLQHSLPGLTEVQMFLWGPAVYGLVFAGVGMGVAAGLIYLYLLFGRWGAWMLAAAAGFAGTLFAGGAGIGLWRIQRDIYAAHGIPREKAIAWLCYVGGAALIGFVLFYVVAALLGRRFNHRWPKLVLAGLGAAAGYVLIGGFMMTMFHPKAKAVDFTAKPDAKGPNIILLSVDTLRADYLKAFNANAVPKTPALDAFFADAALFRGAFAQSSWTKPCFATIFSGLYPEQHTASTKTAPLPDTVHTFPEALREGGYYTVGFPNNPNVSEIFGFQQGFVEYNYLEPSLYFKASASSAKLTLYEILRRVRQIGTALGGKIYKPLGRMVITDFYQPAQTVTDHALGWVDKRATGAAKDAPFFLYLHYMDPHDPFLDPAAPGGGYARVRMEHPDEKLRDPMKHAYVLGIERMDAALQPLFEGLKSRGLYDNTLIVFVSDHGEEFFEHGGWWHGQTLYDELCHVPLALKLPGNALAGTSDAHLSRQLDVAPTVLQIAGLPVPPEMPGKPLISTANAIDNADITHAFASNDFEGNVLESARTLEHKLVVSHSESKRQHPPVGLYDLKADPGEQKNLAEDPAAKPQRDALNQSLEQHRNALKNGTVAAPAAAPGAPGQPATPGEPAAAPNANVKDQLEALGYLGN